VFDLDDTLYLERDYVLSGFRAVGTWVESNLNLTDFARSASELFSSGAGGTTFQKALDVLGHAAEPHLLSEMIRVYRTHAPNISLPADSAYCLAVMGKIAKLGLITDGRPVTQHAKCESLGLLSKLSPIICTGIWGEEFYKPHERAFELMEGQMGSGEDTFVYVADNPLKDFGAPLARGWLTIRIRRSDGLHAHHDSPPQHGPQVELNDLWHFPEVISSLAPASFPLRLEGIGAYANSDLG
jgi:putative hydrolase of the HAD superfamily